MKQKLKEHKGITLVALIITIIVLLILAVVAISAVSGNGILNHAQNAKSSYLEAQTNEQARLDEYSEYLDTESSKINGGGSGTKTLKDSLNKVLSTTDNTPLTDEYGNKITVCMDTSRKNIYRCSKNRSKCKNNNIRKIFKFY